MADFQIFGWTASRNSHPAKSAAPAQTPSSLLLPICPSHGFLGAEVRWECSIEVERSEVVRPPTPLLCTLLFIILSFSSQFISTCLPLPPSNQPFFAFSSPQFEIFTALSITFLTESTPLLYASSATVAAMIPVWQCKCSHWS
jgi:hypothetical protein